MSGNALTFDKYVDGRNMLGEKLPLDMPYTLGIHTTNLCNFKCFYCTASEPPKKRKQHNIILKNIDFELYKKCIDSIAEAGRLKVFFLGGWGEPLLHKDIAKMVSYAKEKDIADLVRIYTNGSLLTHKMSNDLIAAGLDNLRISLQGLCAEDYKKVAGVTLDYQEYIDNIKYLYENKTHMTITAKIMDIMIQKPGQREEFISQFKDICDEYMIDSLTPKVDDIDYTGKGSDLNKSYLEGDAPTTEICAVPFYRAFVDVDAQLFPCAAIPAPRKFGDITKKGFNAVWSGEEYASFLVNMLKSNRRDMPVCSNCLEYRCAILPTDILDSYSEALIPKYENRISKVETL